MKTITVHEMEYHELDALVTREYGHEYEFVPDQEMSNDSAKTGSFTKRDKFLGIDDEKRLAEFRRTGKYSFLWYALMQDLVNRDVLPEGEYVIKVSW